MRTFKAMLDVGVAACLATSLLLLTAGGATANPPCRVMGAGGTYDTLQAAVDAASAGDTLKVGGTCYGDTTISKTLSIVGHGKATLNGANNATSQGSVVTV